VAYSKVPLPCSDYGFGIQDFNKVTANIDATANVLTPLHGTGAGGNAWAALGHHDDPLNPRTVGYYTLTTRGSATITARQVGGPAVRSVVRVDVGEFEVNVQGLLTYSLVAAPTGVAALTPRRFVSSVFEAASRTGPAFFRVQLFEQVTDPNPFELADYPFHFAVWGTTS
jgi:hypothetical protein